MKKTRLVRARGESRPTQFRRDSRSVRFVDTETRGKTRAVGPTGIRGLLEYGPSKPGPFGEVIGLIEESKVVFRYLPWGAVEPGRHSFEVRYEGAEYVLVSRGRRPTPQLEAIDGTVLAVFGNRSGRASSELTQQEEVLVALIAGSGLANVTLPQSWAARH
ncbi:MAG: hypothetical protein HKN80_05425 [Acidimicrobiia bacterium]|nr:hypothetical protein [Acidimicrobiia bacterium]